VFYAVFDPEYAGPQEEVIMRFAGECNSYLKKNTSFILLLSSQRFDSASFRDRRRSKG